MLELQARGCHNINLVTPSHVVAQFIAALYIAARDGLAIPIVYNSSGYDGLESLRLLDGIVDIYMPDIKYSSNAVAKRLSGAGDYWDVVRPAIREMQRQAGVLKVDDAGVAREGLIIRHLILPKNLSGTDAVCKFIADEISKETYMSLMSQYFPAYKGVGHPEAGRAVSREEYERAADAFHNAGLSNGWVQAIHE
jgi:putative pyruvate formate lyase activating enzyme